MNLFLACICYGEAPRGIKCVPLCSPRIMGMAEKLDLPLSVSVHSLFNKYLHINVY